MATKATKESSPKAARYNEHKKKYKINIKKIYKEKRVHKLYHVNKIKSSSRGIIYFYCVLHSSDLVAINIAHY